MKMPDGLRDWTSDEVAETLSFEKYMEKPAADLLYKTLWQLLDEAVVAGTSTPLGGDGSNGTVETPGDRIDPNATDTAQHWWSRLLEHQQQAIVSAFEEEWT